MHKITFECETITPMFLSGANGSTPELRPPSIKGALRFWWRAMNGHLGLADLKRIEGEIFGDTKRRSGVVIRTTFDSSMLDNKKKLEGNPRNYSDQFKQHYELDWEKNGHSYSGNDAGITYLFYSCLFSGKRPFIDTGFTFDIVLQGYNRASLERVIASLWLLVQFGGLGTRVRRGAGAFSCRLKEDKEGVVSSLGISFDSELKNNYKRIKKILKEEGGSDKNPLLFTSLTANEKIYVSSFDKDKQWHECLRPIAKEFMDFRSSKKSEWDKIAVFGIPIRHSSTGGTVQLPKSNRRASPLLISVCKQNGILQWVIVKTSGFFDTSRNGAESLSVVMKGNGFEKGTVDKSRLDDFIKGIDEKTQIA